MTLEKCQIWSRVDRDMIDGSVVLEERPASRNPLGTSFNDRKDTLQGIYEGSYILGNTAAKEI